MIGIPRFQVLLEEPWAFCSSGIPGTECNTRRYIVKLELRVQKLKNDLYSSKIPWNLSEIPFKTASNDEDKWDKSELVAYLANDALISFNSNAAPVWLFQYTTLGPRMPESPEINTQNEPEPKIEPDRIRGILTR